MQLLLLIFAAVILSAQAFYRPHNTFYRSFSSYESSEEEYRIYVPNRFQRSQYLPGIGVVQQPALEAVKIKVPRYTSPAVKQILIRQALAARGLSLQDFAPRDVASGVPQAAGVAVNGATRHVSPYNYNLNYKI